MYHHESSCGSPSPASESRAQFTVNGKYSELGSVPRARAAVQSKHTGSIEHRIVITSLSHISVSILSCEEGTILLAEGETRDGPINKDSDEHPVSSTSVSLPILLILTSFRGTIDQIYPVNVVIRTIVAPLCDTQLC